MNLFKRLKIFYTTKGYIDRRDDVDWNCDSEFPYQNYISGFVPVYKNKKELYISNGCCVNGDRILSKHCGSLVSLCSLKIGETYHIHITNSEHIICSKISEEPYARRIFSGIYGKPFIASKDKNGSINVHFTLKHIDLKSYKWKFSEEDSDE